MENRFLLHTQMILDKEFHIDFKGYSANEVDQFLDMVIADYQRFDEIVSKFGEKIDQLERTNASLKAHIVELEGKQALGTPVNQLSQTDLLKRLAQLENEVYSKAR